MRLTERDLRLLEFVADHRLVRSTHVQSLLEVSASAANGRLRALVADGYLSQRTLFHRQPGCYQITRPGLRAIGSAYAVPRIDLACYQHDVGVAWLWLAASRGAFGPAREVLSERRMRSHDARLEQVNEPLGVRLGGYGPAGKPRLHYPDVLLVLAAGQRVAIELELTGKGQARRQRILSGYAADRRIDAVLYLTDRRSVGQAIQASAQALGVGELIHVQRFRWGERPVAESRVRAQEMTRSSARESTQRLSR